MAAVGSLGSSCLPSPPEHVSHGVSRSASSSFLHRERLDSFLPAHLCKRGHGLFAALRGRGARAGASEQGLLSAYRKVKEAVSSDSECEASLRTHYQAYLTKCHELPYYG